MYSILRVASSLLVTSTILLATSGCVSNTPPAAKSTLKLSGHWDWYSQDVGGSSGSDHPHFTSKTTLDLVKCPSSSCMYQLTNPTDVEPHSKIKDMHLFPVPTALAEWYRRASDYPGPDRCSIHCIVGYFAHGDTLHLLVFDQVKRTNKNCRSDRTLCALVEIFEVRSQSGASVGNSYRELVNSVGSVRSVGGSEFLRSVETVTATSGSNYKSLLHHIGSAHSGGEP